MIKLLETDTQQILTSLSHDLPKLRDSRIVVTGASGFVGKWITKVLMVANEQFSLNLHVLLIGGKTFSSMNRHNTKNFAFKSIDFSTAGNFLDFGFTHAFHASTPSNIYSGSLDFVKTNLVALNSMDFLLKDAIRSKIRPAIIHLSSGAVYAKSHDFDKQGLDENQPVRQFQEDVDYARTKLQLEELINEMNTQGIIYGSNARLFAFSGPYLPLDAHFAIGNFMKNAIDGKPIQIFGNPSTIRSYLYPVDLVILLMKILIEPRISVTNVGSKNPVTLEKVAKTVSKIFGRRDVVVSHQYSEPSSYFPSMFEAEKNYNFSEQVSLEDGLIRWKKWLTSQPRI